MAQQNTNKLYWLAYCDAIKKQVGELGSNDAIFFGSKGLRGPPVNCDKSFLNYGIYNAADSLLAADNLFYSPSSSKGSYSKSLLTYLSWVDVGGNPDDATKFALVQALQYYDACQANVLKEATNGSLEFGKMKDLGMVGANETFSDWVVLNYPSYNNAVTTRNAAAGQVKSAQLALNGPLSSQWNTDFDRITAAINTLDKGQSGLNMPTCQDAPPSVTDILNAQTNHTTLSPPTNLVWRPSYGAPDYTSTVQSWQSVAAKGPTKANSVTLNLQNAKNIREESFGQTKIGGNLGFSYEDIIGVKLSGSSENSQQTINTSDTENQIDITVFWDSMRAATVSPGAWNIADPRGTYPKLKEGAPDSVKILMKPTQLWLVQNLGYTVKFSGSIKTTFDKTVSDVKSAGGQLTFFGIPIGLGADVSSSKTDTTHVGTYDSNSGVFTISPEPNVGFATIVAVVAEKVQTF